MESLTENVQLLKTLLITYGGMLLLASEMMPPFNEFMELHALPSAEFRSTLMGLMLFDLVGTLAYTKLLRWVFAIKPPVKKQKRALSAAEKKTQ